MGFVLRLFRKVYDTNFAICGRCGRWGSPQRMDAQERQALDVCRNTAKGRKDTMKNTVPPRALRGQGLTGAEPPTAADIYYYRARVEKDDRQPEKRTRATARKRARVKRERCRPKGGRPRGQPYAETTDYPSGATAAEHISTRGRETAARTKNDR